MQLSQEDRYNIFIFSIVASFLIFLIIFGCFVSYRTSQIQIEAIEAGLQQNPEGYWVK